MKLGGEIFGNGKLNIIVNIIIFTGMHVVYKGFWDHYLWLLLLLAGTLFTLLYKRFPNIFLVTGVHIILNAIAVYFGIFH